MRRPRADREEKRVACGSETNKSRPERNQLDINDPNQRGHYSPHVGMPLVRHGEASLKFSSRHVIAPLARLYPV